MLIEKSYEENVTFPGEFKSIKIGLTIKSDKDIKTAEELTQVSSKLLTLAKNIVQKELQQVKEEHNNV